MSRLGIDSAKLLVAEQSDLHRNDRALAHRSVHQAGAERDDESPYSGWNRMLRSDIRSEGIPRLRVD